MATAQGIDISRQDDPMVGLLRVAAKEDTSERALATCEHILDSLGATGPIGRRIRRLFNISTAGSKRCKNYHVEGKDLDSACGEFKRSHCDSCPDRKPRPEEWRGAEEEIAKIRARHRNFVASLTGTPDGFRYTSTD